MGVSKRLRFEIFRRDGFACRYCGAMASATEITIDHVIPVALGGSDEPTNLVTSCSDCNAGKSSSGLGGAVVADVAEDALRWAKAQKIAAAQMLQEHNVIADQRRAFEEHWVRCTHDGQPVALPVGWHQQVDKFMAARLPMPVLLECVDKTMAMRSIHADNVFRRMCATAWKRITKIQEETRQLVDATAHDASTSETSHKKDELAWSIFGYLPIDADDDMQEYAAKARANYEEEDEEPPPSLSDTEWAILGAVAEVTEKANILENAVYQFLRQLPREDYQALRRETIAELDRHMPGDWSEVDLLNNMVRRSRVPGSLGDAAMAGRSTATPDPWTVG